MFYWVLGNLIGSNFIGRGAVMENFDSLCVTCKFEVSISLIKSDILISKHKISISPPVIMPTIVPGIIIPKLSIRHSIAIRMRSLLAVRPQTGPRSLPGFAVPWLSNASRAVAMAFVGEGTTRSSRWPLLRLLLLVVDVVQTVHAELVVVSADVEVETESCEGGDTRKGQYNDKWKYHKVASFRRTVQGRRKRRAPCRFGRP
jgi:hypothetical protein